ncbi:MAG: RNA polymerase sigma factor [Planctomycetota bacterium]
MNPGTDLMTRVRSGELAAVEEIVSRNIDWLRRHASPRLDRSLRTVHDSGDLVQDAVVQLLESGELASVRDEEHLRALLARIVNHDVIDLRRRRDLRRLDHSALALRERSVTRPSQHVERSEHSQLLDRSLSGLAEEDRELIRSRVWEELPFSAIAQALGCSEDAARMRFHRALARLADTAERLIQR